MSDPHFDPANIDSAREEQEIAALFRSAGAGDRVPEHELPAIKARARESWRRQVRLTAARRGAGRAMLAIAAAVVLTIAVALMRRVPDAPPADGVEAATIEALAGEATLDGGRVAATHDALSVGAALTTGASGRAALLLASGHSVRVDVASSVRVLSGHSLRLDTGALYVESGTPGAGTSTIEIATSFGVVTDVGTRFEVRLTGDSGQSDTAPALEVRVRDGSVKVTTSTGSYAAAAGSELRLERSGEPERTTAAAWGDDWQWVESVRPPLSIEGFTCREFLDWAARESGRRWRFAGSASGELGDDVVHGSIEGFTVDEALSTVLPSCGLRHRIEGGELLIEADGS
jgi:hypothetical protein